MYCKINHVDTTSKIFTINIKDKKEFQLALNAFEEVAANTKENIQSNVYASLVSDWNSHRYNEKLMILSNYVADVVNETIYRNFGIHPEIVNQKDYDLKIGNVWISHYLKNDFTKDHDHIPSTYSAVLYLKLGEQDKKIRFRDYVHRVDEGDLLFFPAYIRHSVDSTVEERKVIAFNLL